MCERRERNMGSPLFKPFLFLFLCLVCLLMFQCRFANATQVFVVLIESVEVGEHEK